MSNRGSLSRYLSIIKKVEKTRYATYEEIEEHVLNEIDRISEKDDEINIGISKRTFQRVLKEIRVNFDIDIKYNRLNKGYYLVLDEFNIFTTMRINKDLDPHIQYEQRRPLGADNIFNILYAIKNKVLLKFDYQKFWDTEKDHRNVEPYLIKEFKNRWYLMAKDQKDGVIKSFGLDRITMLEITQIRYTSSETFAIEEKYKYCFGIYSSDEKEPSEIILTMDAKNGKYLKSLPLHHTQKVTLDSEKECRISLKLFVTYDLVMELLSFGGAIKVVSPPELVKWVADEHHKAVKMYK
jgi:proteasome accessory factor B